jgi:hypothetical protein
LKISLLYLPLILWALHQILGTAKGDSAYAQLSPILATLQEATP